MIMKQSYLISEIHRLCQHHTEEIKRLTNSDESYKYENIQLLKEELDQFKIELDKLYN
jgi:hypothetical protein